MQEDFVYMDANIDSTLPHPRIKREGLETRVKIHSKSPHRLGLNKKFSDAIVAYKETKLSLNETETRTF
jgi:hypothetical protein